MATAKITPDNDAIVSEIFIAAPPEKVFVALTDAKQIMLWWRDEEHCVPKLWEFDARLGGRWHYQSTDRSGKTINGVREFEASGEVIEFDPPRLLAYTWIANWHEQPSRTTFVRWELQATEGGTKVKVTHSGLLQEPLARKDYSGGWPGVLALLQRYAQRG